MGKGRGSGRQYYGSYGYDRAAGFRIYRQCAGTWRLPEEQLIENPKIKVEGIDDEAKKNKWEYYVNMVYEMDQFAGDLVKAVEDRGEPAVVVFYGDIYRLWDLPQKI